MSVVGSKTPVSIVNEYFIAQRIVPQFELIGRSGYSHMPTFEYKIIAGEYFAVGNGPSKQHAKQNAAQNLLDVLQIDSSCRQLQSALSQVSCPQDNRMNINAVGQLATYCEESKYPEPKYDLIADEGPPHAKHFTFKCVVSSISERGSGRTKKEAKHQSAYAMFAYLKALSGEELNAIVSVNAPVKETPKTDYDKMDEEATALYFSVSKKAVTRAATNGMYIADRYSSYVNYLDKSKTLQCFIESEENRKKMQESALTTLTKIANECNVALVQYPVINPATCTVALIFLKVELIPLLCRGAIDAESAALRALEDLIHFICP